MNDTLRYDHFDFKHYDAKPMSLDEATKVASEMRSRDPQRFYRVVPADESGEHFHVHALEPLAVYAQIIARLTSAWSRLASR